MHLSKIRTVVFAVITASVALAWTLPALAHPATTKGTVVNVVAGKPSEFKFTLSVKKVKHGVPVTFKLTDKGALPHDLKICSSPKGGTANTCAGKASTTIAPGATAVLKVTFKKAGSYEYLCTLPGHAAAGMKGVLKVI